MSALPGRPDISRRDTSIIESAVQPSECGDAAAHHLRHIGFNRDISSYGNRLSAGRID
jgi:hypothetical protein